MVGRKPTPAAAQKAMGDPRKKGKGTLDRIIGSEPVSKQSLPAEAPEHITDSRARAAWRMWVEELTDMSPRLSQRPDAIMLEGAAMAYGNAVKAGEMLDKEGLLIGGLEDPKAHPAVGIAKNMWAQVKAFCTEFGLSPSSRTRLAIEAADDNGPSLQEILNGPRVTEDERVQ